VGGFEPKSDGGTQPFLAAYRVGDGIRQLKAALAAAPATAFTTLAVTPAAVIAGGLNLIEAYDPLTGNVLWSRSLPFAAQENQVR
jgi:hypothetical protein